MTLKEWMCQKGLTQAEVAKMVGCHQTNVGVWLMGRQPRAAMILRIEKASKGAVRLEDWAKAEPAAKAG